MPDSNLAETCAWLDALYGRCTPDDGSIVLVEPSKKSLVSVHPVGSSQALFDAAKAMDGQSGHYAKINLMDAQAMRQRSIQEQKGRNIVGNKDEVKTIVSFHLDVDAGKSDKYLSRDEALAALNSMPHPPSLIVNSNGDDGGFHAYWLLRHPHRVIDQSDRLRVSDAAKRWQNRLNELTKGKLDATANIDRVLRIVGQQRSDGGMVTCHEYHADRLYTLDQLTIRPSVEEIQKDSDDRVRWKYSKLFKVFEADTGKPVSNFIDSAGITIEDLLLDADYTQLTSDEWIRPGSESGEKSLKLATRVDRPGINVFSSNDPHFPCLKRDGAVGQYYSIDQVFVTLRHGGDWREAALWCSQQMGQSFSKSGAAK